MLRIFCLFPSIYRNQQRTLKALCTAFCRISCSTTGAISSSLLWRDLLVLLWSKQQWRTKKCSSPSCRPTGSPSCSPTSPSSRLTSMRLLIWTKSGRSFIRYGTHTHTHTRARARTHATKTEERRTTPVQHVSRLRLQAAWQQSGMSGEKNFVLCWLILIFETLGFSPSFFDALKNILLLNWRTNVAKPNSFRKKGWRVIKSLGGIYFAPPAAQLSSAPTTFSLHPESRNEKGGKTFWPFFSIPSYLLLSEYGREESKRPSVKWKKM